MSKVEAFRKLLIERREAAYQRMRDAINAQDSSFHIRDKATYEELDEVLQAFARYFPK